MIEHAGTQIGDEGSAISELFATFNVDGAHNLPSGAAGSGAAGSGAAGASAAGASAAGASVAGASVAGIFAAIKSFILLNIAVSSCLVVVVQASVS